MMSTQSPLDEMWAIGRDYGSTETRILINEWDRLTELSPLEAIEKASDNDLKERVAELEEENSTLEGRNSALAAALEQLRYNAFWDSKRFSYEFSEDYDYYQESTARQEVREVAPDVADDVHACYILIKYGELEEVWTSPSFSTDVAFSRVY
jgi:predicted nuclease with TOPRIM domain